MAQNGFRHISVTMPDDEDEVITAGLPNAEADGPVVSDGGELEGDLDGSDEGELDAIGSEAASKVEVAPESETQPARGQQAAPPAKRAVASGKPKDAGYQQPTLEDLEGEPMSMTQRIVIIAAVVCIIGAVVYYLVFMR